jgi:hypothetical protein
MTQQDIDNTLRMLTPDQSQRWATASTVLGEDFTQDQWEDLFGSFLAREGVVRAGLMRPLEPGLIPNTLDRMTRAQIDHWIDHSMYLGRDAAPSDIDAAWRGFIRAEAMRNAGTTDVDVFNSVVATSVLMTRAQLTRMAIGYFGLGLVVGVLGTVFVMRRRAQQQATTPSSAQWW